MRFDVFISYSRKDYKDIAGNEIAGNYISMIKTALANAGLTYWIDEEGIYSGDEFLEAILSNIENSGCVVFVSTEASNQSKWTSKEIHLALQEGKRIIPIICSNTSFNKSLRLLLADIDFIDVRVNPNQGMIRLINAVKENRERLDKIREEQEIVTEIRELDITRKSLKEELNNLRNRYLSAKEEYISNLGKINTLFESLQERDVDVSNLKDEVNLSENVEHANTLEVPDIVEIAKLKQQKNNLEHIIEEKKREIDLLKKTRGKDSTRKRLGFLSILAILVVVCMLALLLRSVALQERLTKIGMEEPVIVTRMETEFNHYSIHPNDSDYGLLMRFYYICPDYSNNYYTILNKVYDPSGNMIEWTDSSVEYTWGVKIKTSEITYAYKRILLKKPFPEGEYRWEIWLDGKCIATKVFTNESK